MTSGELKFALAVETVLNWIPYPEYRQLIVETLMIFTVYAEDQISPHNTHDIITIEDFVHKANELFLLDQVGIFFFTTNLNIHVYCNLYIRFVSTEMRLCVVPKNIKS